MTNFHYVESNASTLDGSPAYKLVFTHSLGQHQDGIFKEILVLCVKGDKLYKIKFVTPELSYYKFLPNSTKDDRFN